MGTVAVAIREVLASHLEHPQAVLLGDSVGRGGGVEGTSAGLAQRFGADRVVDLPIADRASVGFAMGLALSGQRPVVTLSGTGRLVAVLEVLLDAAELAARGVFVPLVVRVPYGGEAGRVLDRAVLVQLTGHPGLRVVCASSATPASVLLAAALQASGPVVVLEPRALYGTPVSASDAVTLGGARVLREGRAATVCTWGAGVDVALDLPEDVEVIDLVSLSPLDLDTLGPRLRRSGRLVVAAPDDAAFAQQVLSVGMGEAFWYLESKPVAVLADRAVLEQAVR